MKLKDKLNVLAKQVSWYIHLLYRCARDSGNRNICLQAMSNDATKDSNYCFPNNKQSTFSL